MTITIDRLQEADWMVLRSLRLAALADSPQAFWARLEDESGNSDEDWKRFARMVAWYVARRDDQPVGLAGGLVRAESPQEPTVIGMWVAPDERRHGVGALLLAEVCAWGQQHGNGSVTLWVVEGNEGARRLYERQGFQATGECKALPREPGRPATEERMRRPGR